jgi:polyisoprenoid-binding protein YceI
MFQPYQHTIIAVGRQKVIGLSAITTLVLTMMSANSITTAHAAPLTIDYSKSQLTATAQQMNVPIEGKFKQFTASIDWQTQQPTQFKASVDIDLNSYDIGAEDFNKELRKKEWFNTAQYPKAHLTVTQLTVLPAKNTKDGAKNTATQSFNAAGLLTLKGQTLPVVIALTVTPQSPKGWLFSGQTTLSRLKFHIGEGEWRDTGAVPDEVIVKFNVFAQ